MKIAVLGAGVCGVTTAYFLASDGHAVTVVDRAGGPARETSFANGGVVGGTQVEPWAQPGLPWKILRWLGRDDAPVLLRLRELPKLHDWGRRFLARCNEASVRQALEANVRLTRYSVDMFARLRETAGMSGSDYDLNRQGALKLYFTSEAFDHARRSADVLRACGIDVRAIDGDAAADREPALRSVARQIVGALSFPDEEIGDCRKFVEELDARCRGLGVAFLYGTETKRLRRLQGRIAAAVTSAGEIDADAFVVAQASYTPQLLRSVGLRVPIIPIKGVSVTVPAHPWADAVRSAVMDHSRLFGIMRTGDRLRISGSAEVAGYDAVPSPARCRALIDSVLELFPDFSSCLAAAPPFCWAGLRGNTPDGIPVLGRTLIANLFLNAGHGPQGWSTSCGSAKLVADAVSGRDPGISLAAFELSRFS